MNMNNIPAGWNHPDSTPIKQEEPDDWFSNKPVPTWTFGDHISCPTILIQNKALEGEVIGLVWLPYKKGHSWWYCVAAVGQDTGWWISEVEIRNSSVSAGVDDNDHDA